VQLCVSILGVVVLVLHGRVGALCRPFAAVTAGPTRPVVATRPRLFSATWEARSGVAATGFSYRQVDGINALLPRGESETVQSEERTSGYQRRETWAAGVLRLSTASSTFILCSEDASAGKALFSLGPARPYRPPNDPPHLVLTMLIVK